MKILIISDAWKPQLNGVVRTLERTSQELTRMGHEVRITGPDTTRLTSFAVPSYTEIRLEFFARARLGKILHEFVPDFIHIATEGPLGWAARNLCLKQGLPFTTSYHTRFPEYLAARSLRFLAQAVEKIAYALLRRFHAPSASVMVATASMEQELRAHKFYNIMRWSRGVDREVYTPTARNDIYGALPHPVLLYVGRVAIEKNLPAFLNLKTTGSLVVIGDGPDLHSLQQKYPAAHFLGTRQGAELAASYASADLFVFPSLTDTFGLVLLEACASGLRIAACPAPGPSDLFATPDTEMFARLNTDLQQAVADALALPDTRSAPCAFAAHFSWEACTAQFYKHLQAPSPTAIRKIRRWRHKIGTGL